MFAGLLVYAASLQQGRGATVAGGAAVAGGATGDGAEAALMLTHLCLVMVFYLGISADGIFFNGTSLVQPGALEMGRNSRGSSFWVLII